LFLAPLLFSALACSLGQETPIAPPPATVLTRIAPTTGEVVIDGAGTAVPVVTFAPGGDPTPTLAAGLDPGVAFDLQTVPTDIDSLAAWIVGAYGAQTPLEQVCLALQTASWQLPAGTCAAVDLDGNNQLSWLVTVHNLAESSLTAPDDPPGEFWVVAANTVFRQRFANPEGTPETAPAVAEVVDLTGDGRVDILITNTRCVESNCLSQFQLLSKHNGQLENLVNLPAGNDSLGLAPIIIMSNVEVAEIQDANEDGVDDFVLQGGREEPAGETTQRARTEIWSFDGQAFTLAEATFADSNLRHHKLYDANAAFDQGDVDLAAQRYQAVVVDLNLEDVPSAGGSSAAETRAAARQFAAFRLVILPLLRGDVTDATRWRNWLQETYPQAPITAAAVQVLAEWEANRNDLVAACVTVTGSLAAVPDPTDGLVDMGPGNPPLTADDVCPYR
jgi:hypothetical protein